MVINTCLMLSIHKAFSKTLHDNLSKSKNYDYTVDQVRVSQACDCLNLSRSKNHNV